ncbi:SHOCT domain-containing protein [Clostridioides difficile]|nr:SHOCT domain-containing protein [Clostridioides difficile]MBT2146749.1 SHOCT domain-containing protein [Clostridioides difficile]
MTNPLEQIKTLKELLDMDAITQEEFDVKKKNY